VGSDGSRKDDESATECHIDWSCGLDPCVAFYANLRAAAVDSGRRDVEKEKRAAMSRKRKGQRCREREKGGDVEKEKRPARRAFHVLFSGIREHGLRRKLPNVVTAGYHFGTFSPGELQRSCVRFGAHIEPTII
jgi:hypothetical protein